MGQQLAEGFLSERSQALCLRSPRKLSASCYTMLHNKAASCAHNHHTLQPKTCNASKNLTLNAQQLLCLVELEHLVVGGATHLAAQHSTARHDITHHANAKLSASSRNSPMLRKRTPAAGCPQAFDQTLH